MTDPIQQLKEIAEAPPEFRDLLIRFVKEFTNFTMRQADVNLSDYLDLVLMTHHSLIGTGVVNYEPDELGVQAVAGKMIHNLSGFYLSLITDIEGTLRLAEKRDYPE